MNFWQGLTQRARIGLAIGAALILLVTALAAWWVFRVDYQVLFADLNPQDAQAMTTELERLKIPYRIGDSGNTILVDKATVHATRIKLMGRDLPLHGAVGLELFNNTDFGMTEFAQKINYQRALQGELTRTIQSLSEVREVRVLLALPEQGLFKQATSKAKASITVALRQGQALRPEQVNGIQRLVAAAVPGMTRQDVTIADNHGVALTRAEGGEGETDLNSARLDLKRDTEAYLSRKAGAVLDRAFGPGQALASVDVTLNMDQIRTTTEDVLPAAARSGLQSTGVVVREREVLRDAGNGLENKAGDAARGSSQREVEYAVGRRVEQIVSQPGSVRHIQVAAVVRKALDAGQEEQLRKVIAAAVGAVPERGDLVVVQSLAGAASLASQAMPAAAGDGIRDVEGTMHEERAAPLWSDGARPLPVLLAVLLTVASAALIFRSRGRRAGPGPGAGNGRPMSEAERAAALRRVRDWMNETGPSQAAPLPGQPIVRPPMAGARKNP
jgi:flagellar M-ring protein FliF